MDALTKESHFILDLDIGFWMMSDFLSPTRQISYLQFGLNFLFTIWFKFLISYFFTLS